MPFGQSLGGGQGTTIPWIAIALNNQGTANGSSSISTSHLSLPLPQRQLKYYFLSIPISCTICATGTGETNGHITRHKFVQISNQKPAVAFHIFAFRCENHSVTSVHYQINMCVWALMVTAQHIRTSVRSSFRPVNKVSVCRLLAYGIATFSTEMNK